MHFRTRSFEAMPQLDPSHVGTRIHQRGVNRIDHNQTVVRMNRDTFYSGAIVDISKGATLTIPETHGRYVSVMVVNEDHYLKRIPAIPQKTRQQVFARTAAYQPKGTFLRC